MRFFIIIAVLLLSWSQASARQGDERLDSLFEQLNKASDPQEARIYEIAIWQIWLESNSATLDLLMTHGVMALQAEEHDRALEIFTHLIELDPDFAEGWNKRATVLYLLGARDAALKDIERTLALEPRHFGALAGLASILDDKKDYEGEIRALSRALAANPFVPSAKDRLKELTRKVRGDPI